MPYVSYIEVKEPYFYVMWLGYFMYVFGCSYLFNTNLPFKCFTKNLWLYILKYLGESLCDIKHDMIKDEVPRHDF